jgi:hypothetical protein
MTLHRREAVVHAVERIDTKAPVDVIGLIGVRQPDRVQVELMKVDRVRLLRIEIGRIAIEGTACCAGLVLRRAEIAADLDPAGEMSRHSPGKAGTGRSWLYRDGGFKFHACGGARA